MTFLELNPIFAPAMLHSQQQINISTCLRISVWYPVFWTPTPTTADVLWGRCRLPFWPRALLLDLAVDLRLMFTFHTLVMIDCNTVYFCVKTWHLSTRVANVAGFSNALNVDYDIIIRVFVGIAFCIAFTVKFVHVKSSNKCTWKEYFLQTTWRSKNGICHSFCIMSTGFLKKMAIIIVATGRISVVRRRRCVIVASGGREDWTSQFRVFGICPLKVIIPARRSRIPSNTLFIGPHTSCPSPNKRYLDRFFRLRTGRRCAKQKTATTTIRPYDINSTLRALCCWCCPKRYWYFFSRSFVNLWHS